MIKGYEIKYINDEEILCLYFDYSTEFSRMNSKKNKKKLKKYINEFIDKHNINFKGTKVAIMLGSIMIGTIILNKDIKTDNYVNNIDNSYVVSLVDNNINLKDDICEEISKEDEEVLDEIKKTEETNEDKSKDNSKDEVKEVLQELNDADSVMEEEHYVNSVNKIFVKLYRTSGEILDLELEDYIVGVVAAEMPVSFNIEALKAQSIVSRTYTLKALKNGKKLTDNSSTQNYKSNEELLKMWGKDYNKYLSKVEDAVNSTKGMFLSYNGDYIEAVYHSTSNGKTENSKYVWENEFSYLVSVDSPYDTSNKSFLSINYFSNEILSNKLGQNITRDTIYNIVSRNGSGRVNTIFIDNIMYSGVELRNILGLRSTDFDIEVLENGINVTTRGYGHGVGMSQYGANGMANNGSDFVNILKHYYKGVIINSI